MDSFRLLSRKFVDKSLGPPAQTEPSSPKDLYLSALFNLEKLDRYVEAGLRSRLQRLGIFGPIPGTEELDNLKFYSEVTCKPVEDTPAVITFAEILDMVRVHNITGTPKEVSKVPHDVMASGVNTTFTKLEDWAANAFTHHNLTDVRVVTRPREGDETCSSSPSLHVIMEIYYSMFLLINAIASLIRIVGYEVLDNQTEVFYGDVYGPKLMVYNEHGYLELQEHERYEVHEKPLTEKHKRAIARTDE